MDVPQLQTHRDTATALWRQRCEWLGRPAIGAEALRRLEHRLHLQLYVLARMPAEEGAAEPEQAEAAFVHLAAGLRAPVPERREAAAGLAAEWLAGDHPARREAAFHALALHPGGETVAATRRLWDEQPDRRALLADIWRIQGADVPRGLLNQGELHTHDGELQAAVLRFSADWPEAGLSVFQTYYRPLLDNPFTSSTELPVLAEALRGGLLRGDDGAALALRRAIEQQASREAAAPLLRLAALSGEPDFHPVLQQHLQADPAGGCHLLALWGHREAVPDLIEALASPRANEAAAEAWHRLTGQRLPSRPRMQVVGEDAPAETGESIADAEAARQWWQGAESHWPAGERRLHGQPLVPQALLAALETDAGRGAADALDLLGILAGRPVGVVPAAWMQQRADLLAAFPLPAQPATSRAAHA